jgi:predicted permease
LKLAPAREAEIVEEVAQHLEDRYQELVAGGATEDEARRGTLEELSEEDLLARGLRRAEREAKQEPVALGGGGRSNFLASLWQDIRYGTRQLRHSAGFTAVAIVTLALGIGANTAIFSVINAVFLRPLPFPHANRIYVVARVGNQFGGFSLSIPIFLAWKKQQGLFDHLALLAWRGERTLSSEGEPEQIPSAGASTELFTVLGVHPALGRDFRPEEGRPGGANVVILSDGLWRSRFGQDKSILGRTITLNQESYTIIGVLPRGFEVPLPGIRNAELWLPVRIPLASNNPSNGDLLCLGLLKSGVTPAQGGAALTSPLAELRREFPSMFTPGERAYLVPLRHFVADWAGPAPLLLFGAVVLVLLIACANVANLTLARSTTRQREMAIRTAIGARRGRIVRQLLTESVLLALLGGAFGVLACYACFNFVVALVPADLPHVGALQMDWTVLLFAMLLSLVTGIVFGLVPALGTSRVDLSASLKEASLQLGPGGRGRLRSVLAASEVSITLVLLIGAALTLESFAGLMRVRPGFDPRNLLTFRVTLPEKKYDTPAKRAAYFREAVSRISALPGVERAGLVSFLPLEGGPDTLFSIEGASSQQSSEILGAVFRAIDPGYFQTLHIPVLRGRAFSDSDNAGSEPVVVINQTMAKRYWPCEDAIGQRIWIGKPMGPANAEPAPREIVGIVSDIHEMTLAEPPVPTMYMPYAQRPQEDQAFFVLRTLQAPLASLPDVRGAMRGVDADLPLAEIRTMEQVLSTSLADWRFHAILLGAFGSLALLISTIGIYGVISYSVAQRTHEMGVRMALGAARRDVVKLVVGQGLRLALAGIAIGLVGALALTRFLASILFGVKPTDPLTFVSVCLILTVVAVLASYLPARRATKVDPMVALRYE